MAVTVLVVLAGACSSTPDDRVALVESIGDQLAATLRAPLAEAAGAAGDAAVEADAHVTELLADTIHGLPLPEDVEDLIPGQHRRTGRSDDGFAYVGTSIAVFREEASDFCMVVALGSGGQVEARLVAAEPTEMCEGAEIPNLLQASN